MEETIKNSFDNYFNNLLKITFKYADIFYIDVDLNIRAINLIIKQNDTFNLTISPILKQSQLINILNTNKNLTKRLENDLLYAFQRKKS